MSLTTITPAEAKRLIEKGAALVDIREPGEHARENIPGARLVPLSKMEARELGVPPGAPVLFHCKSGARTRAAAGLLAQKAGSCCKAYIVEGGIDAWRRAGLPVAQSQTSGGSLLRSLFGR